MSDERKGQLIVILSFLMSAAFIAVMLLIGQWRFLIVFYGLGLICELWEIRQADLDLKQREKHERK